MSLRARTLQSLRDSFRVKASSPTQPPLQLHLPQPLSCSLLFRNIGFLALLPICFVHSSLKTLYLMFHLTVKLSVASWLSFSSTMASFSLPHSLQWDSVSLSKTQFKKAAAFPHTPVSPYPAFSLHYNQLR